MGQRTEMFQSWNCANLMMKYRHIITVFLICRKKSHKFQSAKMEWTEASEFIFILNTKNFRENWKMCQDLASAHLRNSKSKLGLNSATLHRKSLPWFHRFGIMSAVSQICFILLALFFKVWTHRVFLVGVWMIFRSYFPDSKG